MKIDELRAWIGRTESATDRITPVPVTALAATLDRARPASTLPPLWHWLYFLPVHAHGEIGPDGHPRRGGFLPPVPLPRRMWAGSRLQFHAPLDVGEEITRVSQIVDVSAKEGRSGSLVFVLVRHQISNDAGVAVTEEHDIVYRDAAQPGEVAPPLRPASADHHWKTRIDPDPVLLFRYSALTFNGHRIHYDRSYVTGVEGYPGLIVHGPLIATLLLDSLARQLPQADVESFQFRAVKPTFDIEPFFVCGRQETDGRTVKLWAQDEHGNLAMEATAVLRAAAD